jgi:hypothetical protein
MRYENYITKEAGAVRMKKYMAWLTAVLLLAGSMAILGGPAEAESTASDIPSIDAVIVMDQSNSMSGGNNSNTINDPNGNRFDAALMLVGMCDMNGSRVAFLPFANRSLLNDYEKEYPFSDFVPIRDESLRNQQWKAIEALRKTKTFPGTDLGIAIASAINLLLDRDDKTNSPMIILLTDGDNDVANKGESKQGYEWNESQDRFVIRNFAQYSDTDADELTEQATLVAKNKGIPIYTIQLLDISNSAELENKLSGIAAKTEGLYKKIKPENAYELPLVFGEVFASKIGSQLMRDLKTVKDQSGHCYVNLPILNKSLLEANIYIPLDGIQNVKLYDPQKNDRTGGANDVIWSESQGRFWLYKINEPRVLGDWRLEFDLKDTNGSAADVSISMLYNYSITLKTQLGSRLSPLQEAQMGITMGKGDMLRVSSRFYGSDGSPTQDSALYTVWPVNEPGDEWKTIKASYQLLSGDGKTLLFGGELVNQGDGFAADIDLAHAYTDGSGKNMLNQGDYLLKVTADGAGLHREEVLPVTLLNQTPQASDGSAKQELSKTIRVDDPNKPETQDVQTVEFDLSKLIADPDNDAVQYEFRPEGDATAILPLTLDKSTGIISGQTVRNETTGMFGSGDAVYTLTVKDADLFSQPADWAVTVHVESEASKFLDNNKCVTTYTAIDPNGNVKKGTDIVFSMHLEDSSGAPDTTGKIMKYTGQAAICSADNDSVVLQTIDMVLNDQKTALTATYTTPCQSNGLQAKFTYQYSSYDKKQATDSVNFTVTNAPPRVIDSALDSFPTQIAFDPLPGFLSALQQPTPADALVIPLNKLFADDDNEPLAYNEPVFKTENGDDSFLMLTDRQGMVQHFTPVGSGKLLIIITALDGDGVEAQASINVTIVSITQKWTRIGIMVLAALIALILLIFIIHQVRKPRFPEDGLIMTRENSALYESDKENLPSSKKTIKLSGYVSELVAEKNGIPAEFLSRIWIKPSRSADGSILVRCEKQLPDCKAYFNGENTDLGRKDTPWGMDRELMIESSQTGNILRIQLTRSQQMHVREFESRGVDDFDGVDKSDDFEIKPSVPDRRVNKVKNNYDDTDF